MTAPCPRLPTYPGDTPGFVPCAGPVPDPLPEGSCCLVVAQGDRFVCDPDGAVVLPASCLGALPLDTVHRLGTLDGQEVFVAGLGGPNRAVPDPWTTAGLRDLVMTQTPTTWAAAALASQVVHWDRTTRFCGLCGTPMAQPDLAHRAKVCPGCGHTVWPRISPCVITLVYDDAGRVLLGRKAEWPAGRYGLLAGFVEPGESLEDAVRRECLEETGIAVTDVEYRGSQPWPFPHQLMVGFWARAEGTEVTAGDGELEDARWFSRDALPRLPPRLSIARSLIDAWFDREDARS